VEVEGLAVPARQAGLMGDPGRDPPGDDGDARAAVTARARDAGQAAPIGATERQAAGGRAFDAVAAFVEQAMVVATKLDEIGQRGLAAVRPVLDVVRVDVLAVVAPRELTTAVAAAQRAAESRWDRPRLATDGQRSAFALQDTDQRRVAAQSTYRFPGERSLVIELAAAAHIVRTKRVDVDVDDDLTTVAAGA
jgi:hypothetical protein